MIFKTVRNRKSGEYRFIKSHGAGARGRFGVFRFEIASEPGAERIEVSQGPSDPFGNFPTWFPAIREGILEGNTCLAWTSEAMCSFRVVVTSIRDHPLDSGTIGMTRMGREWFDTELVPALSEIIPPIPDPLRTPTVIALSKACRQDHSFDRLPILADALEEAGCTDALILEHCRQCTDHGSQCWVVDWVLDPVVLPIPRDRVAGRPERA